MPIEFNCTQCDKRLKVPDESAGSKARCPQCQNVIEVPASNLASPGPATVPPSPTGNYPPGNQPPSDVPNPFSAPAAGIPHAKKTAATGEPTAVDAGSVIEVAWDTWKQNLGILVGMTLIVFAINFVIGFGQQILIAILAQANSIEVAIGVSYVISFFAQMIQIFLGIGQTQIILKLLRGQNVELGELFGGGPLFLRTLGASIVAGLAVVLGFVALIIPGILLMLFFWPFYHFIVDNKAKAMESFSMALPVAKLNIGTTLVLVLASMGIMIVGVLALCVGVFFAQPLVTTMWGAAYLMMSGQIGGRQKY